MRYEGRLVGHTATGSLYIRDKVDSAFTILREDGFAFAALDVPSRSGNRSLGLPSFLFSVTVTVPVGQVVATGGLIVGTVRHDGRTDGE